MSHKTIIDQLEEIIQKRVDNVRPILEKLELLEDQVRKVKTDIQIMLDELRPFQSIAIKKLPNLAQIFKESNHIYTPQALTGDMRSRIKIRQRNRQKQADEQITKILELKERGLSVSEVSSLLSISKAVIYMRLKIHKNRLNLQNSPQ